MPISPSWPTTACSCWGRRSGPCTSGPWRWSGAARWRGTSKPAAAAPRWSSPSPPGSGPATATASTATGRPWSVRSWPRTPPCSNFEAFSRTETEKASKFGEDLVRQGDSVELRGVLAAHLPDLGGGDVAPVLLEHFLGVGPGAVAVGIVDLDHDVVDADHVAQADGRGV